MACRAASTLGDESSERRSRRLQIAEARLLAEYLDRARSMAADVDPGVEAQLILLHARTLRHIEVLHRFEPPCPVGPDRLCQPAEMPTCDA